MNLVRNKSKQIINAILLVIVALWIPIVFAQSNYALQFDDKQGDYVDITSGRFSSGDEPTITITAWIKCEESESFRGIIGWGEDQSVGLGIGGPNYTNGAGMYIWVVHAHDQWNTGVDLNPDWNHIAYVHSGYMDHVYLNGVLVASNRVGPYDISSDSTGSIGRWRGSGYFKGIIDEVYIWRIALSQIEIQDYMFHSLTGSEVGLDGQWKFDEGEGIIAHDTGGDHTSIINGAEWVISDIPMFGQDSLTLINIPNDLSTIQKGIIFADPGDTVLVHPGIYFENLNFYGKNAAVGSFFLTTGDTSYISQTIINANDSGRVVTIETYEDSTALLTGFTITGGNSEFNTDNNGGGIKCWRSSPRLEHLYITNNCAYNGAGIYLSRSNSNLRNLKISDNKSYDESLTISIPYYGGGIYISDSNCNLSNLIIKNNSAQDEGGGIEIIKRSEVYIKNLTIVNNFAADSHGGGIIIRDSSSISITNSILWSNEPEQIVCLDQSFATIQFSNISGGLTNIIIEDEVQLDWLDGNINALPLFCDPDNGNYTLAANSLCLETGENGANMGALGLGCGPAMTDNTALRFNGVNDNVFIAESGSGLSGNFQLTFSGWFLWEGGNFPSERGIDRLLISVGNDWKDWSLYLDPLDNGKPSFTVSGDYTNRVIASTVITDSLWHHIAASYNGEIAKIYIDGFLENSNSQDIKGLEKTDTRISHEVYAWDGVIDEVHTWNIARTEEQIQTDMLHVLTGTEPGLVGYWSFNEGAGDTTYDFSTNSNKGIISGAEWIISDIPMVYVTPSIIINEVMYAPATVPGGSGEWFELFNPNPNYVDLTGWIIKDADYDYHIIDQQLVIPPRDFLVFSIDSNKLNNGGVDVDYQYEQTYLGNSYDELILTTRNGSIVDSICWDNGITFPAVNGASIKLIDHELDNAIGSNWARSVTPFINGDYGTPGIPNFIPMLLIDSLIVFDTVKVGDSILIELGIYNIGDDTLNVTSLYTNSGIFSPLTGNITIDPQDTGLVEIRFAPVDTGLCNDTLYIISNAYYNSFTAIVLSGVALVSDLSNMDGARIPTEFALHQNYPNPFNPITTIQYELPERSDVKIVIYDLLGNEVATLVNEIQKAGFKSVQWDASNVASGVYFYQIRAGNPSSGSGHGFVQTRKMVVLK